MESAAASPGSGLGASLRRVGATLLELAQTRLELLATEFEEELLHLGQVLIRLLAAMFFFALAVVLASAMVVVLCPVEWAVAVLGLFAIGYAAIGALLWRQASRALHVRERSFSATLGELERDRQILSGS